MQGAYDPHAQHTFTTARSEDLRPFKLFVKQNNPACLELQYAVSRNPGLSAKIQVIDISVQRPPASKDGKCYVPTVVDTLAHPYVFVGTEAKQWVDWRGKENSGSMPMDGGTQVGSTTFAPALREIPLTPTEGGIDPRMKVEWRELPRDGSFPTSLPEAPRMDAQQAAARENAVMSRFTH